MFSNCSRYVKVNGIKVLDGCARCISENGWCRDAAKLVNAESVLAEPMSYMDGPLDFPVKCLKDWWGKHYNFCPECGVAFYEEYFALHCPNCGFPEEPENDIGNDDNDYDYYEYDEDIESYQFYNDYTDEVVTMEGCRECVERYGDCPDIECLSKHKLVYTEPFGYLPHGFLLPDYCAYTLDNCQRYCIDCRQATTEEIDTCPLCGGEMREFF